MTKDPRTKGELKGFRPATDDVSWSSRELLVGAITHSLKGHINGIDGGLYFLNSGLSKDSQDRVDKGLLMIRRNLERLRNSVSTALYHLKTREVLTEDVDLATLYSRLKKAFEPRIQQLEALLTLDGEGMFSSDEHCVYSILVNLLEFAFDACQANRGVEKHAIAVEATFAECEIVLEITHNGIKMTAEELARDYSQYKHVGPGKTDFELYIVNELVASLGGSFCVGPAGGARFRVQLPRTPTS